MVDNASRRNNGSTYHESFGFQSNPLRHVQKRNALQKQANSDSVSNALYLRRNSFKLPPNAYAIPGCAILDLCFLDGRRDQIVSGGNVVAT